jgi:hypothetical protein
MNKTTAEEIRLSATLLKICQKRNKIFLDACLEAKRLLEQNNYDGASKETKQAFDVLCQALNATQR